MNMRHWRLNGWRRWALLPALLLAILMLVLAASLGTRGTAHAQTVATATFTIASPAKLLARTTLQISITASCTIPAGGTLLGTPGGGVSIVQASGRQIVQASSGFFNIATCDGSTQTFQVFATPPAGSAPFHGGSATATASIFISWIDSLGNLHEDQLSSNPEVIRISG